MFRMPFSWYDSENVKIVKEAINTKSSNCIDAYQALLRHCATGRLSFAELLDASMKEMGESVKKCMNFANVLLMLYDFFGTSFSDALNNEKLQKRFEEILISMIPINNLASRKLAWLMKSIFPKSESGLLGLCHLEGINLSSWIPELSAADLNRLLRNAHNESKEDNTIDSIKRKLSQMNDIREAQITKKRVGEYIVLLQRDHKFIQNVMDSFIPLEHKENPLEELLKHATEIMDQVNALLVRSITVFGLNLFCLSVYLIYSMSNFFFIDYLRFQRF
ncbi:unnamed protein product [Rodentolepis nana]|uniref:Uncharacterized protein n=1 Tax=Rodentolepis nana TaxID=102285 RepID=A0A0R3TCF0_RODNA|nr:unnamed protein product [Rodentolepis nana]